MPELPEVETTKTSLHPLVGQTLLSTDVYQPKLRWQVPENLDILDGATLLNVSRRAKYLLLDWQPTTSPHPCFSNIPTLMIHLGMSGSLQQLPTGHSKRKHDHVIFRFSNIQLHYHDPRRFGSILWKHDYTEKLLDNLGPEPLTKDFNATYLASCCQYSNRPIKTVIMDQKIVVGVGNIYATESLFLSGIHPAMTAGQLYQHPERIKSLVQHIKSVLTTAIQQGGTTLKDFTVTAGEKTGYFKQALNVYGRAGLPCPQCATLIQTVKIGQRASSFCQKCQPLLTE